MRLTHHQYLLAYSQTIGLKHLYNKTSCETRDNSYVKDYLELFVVLI